MRGLITIEKLRPDGYEYPIGLHSRILTDLANAATNTTGGTQTIDGDNAVHTFTTSGFFEPSFTGDVEYLVVAGGGSGGMYPGSGNAGGGGGGAGGYLYASGHPVTASANLTVEVGAGGAGGANPSPGSVGTNSVFDSVTSVRGGVSISAPNTTAPGGSGGGGNSRSPGGGNIGGLGTPGQGNDGGDGNNFGNGSGGGGGAGAAGGDNAGDTGGAAGAGLTNSIGGSPVIYAVGGAGAPGGTAASGGSAAAEDATANRGNGGGGSFNAPTGLNKGAGGSGIVIIRYQSSQSLSNEIYDIGGANGGVV